MRLLHPRCRHQFEDFGAVQRCRVCGGECGHAYVKSGERIKTGSSGRMERYQEVFTCTCCNTSEVGPWRTREVTVPLPVSTRKAQISDLYQ